MNARPTLRLGTGGGAEAAANRKGRRRADASIGPYARGGGGVWQTGRIMAGQGAAPLRRLRRHLPLQGRLLGRQPIDSLPCKGRWMRRKAQTEGGIAGWRRRYPARSGRRLPRIRRGRCWHRPANLAAAPGSAAGEIARPTKHPQAGDDAEAAVVRQVRRRADASIGPYAGGRRSAADRKGIGEARCGTPPSPAATPPLAGEAFGGAVPATACGSCGRANFAGRCGHRVLCREGVGGKRKAPSAADAGRGGWGQKKRSPALKVSMGPDQRARTAAALSLV